MRPKYPPCPASPCGITVGAENNGCNAGTGEIQVSSLFLEDGIEGLHPALPRGKFRSVLFDFDGTLSLIREGWPQVMIPMMVEELQATGTPESPEQLTAAVEEFVMRLNGRQTIYQMMQLAEEVRRRGGRPQDPLVYKHRYHELLMARI